MFKQKMKMRTDERGVVAVIVTIIIMVILSLIALAMSQDARREQRQSIDRQLSDQAFYNAETGINDTAAYLYANPSAPLDNKSTGCNPIDTSPSAPSRDIDGATGSNKYTCVQYNKAPETLWYDGLSISTPKVIPIQTVNNAGAETNISSLTISWDDAVNPGGPIAGTCNFSSGGPELPTNCDYGGVRVDIVIPDSSRSLINQRSFTSFLLPNASSGSSISLTGAVDPDNKGIISATNCTAVAGQRRCNKTVNDINRNNFFLTIRALYRPVNLSISGEDINGTTLRFKNAQTMIDATGRANDVLRRVQVRIPAVSQYDYPGYALQTKESICKIIEVTQDINGTRSANSTDTARCPIN